VTLSDSARPKAPVTTRFTLTVVRVMPRPARAGPERADRPPGSRAQVGAVGPGRTWSPTGGAGASALAGGAGERRRRRRPGREHRPHPAPTSRSPSGVHPCRPSTPEQTSTGARAAGAMASPTTRRVVPGADPPLRQGVDRGTPSPPDAPRCRTRKARWARPMAMRSRGVHRRWVAVERSRLSVPDIDRLLFRSSRWSDLRMRCSSKKIVEIVVAGPPEATRRRHCPRSGGRA
jgi:hypothetical protein